jgi:hypothetical protein
MIGGSALEKYIVYCDPATGFNWPMEGQAVGGSDGLVPRCYSGADENKIARSSWPCVCSSVHCLTIKGHAGQGAEYGLGSG